MSSLDISASIVIPMFIYMTAGVVVRKSGMMDKNALDQMNRLVFRVFLSTSLYYNICAADLTEVFDLRLMIFAVAAQAAIAVFSLAVASVCEKRDNRIHREDTDRSCKTGDRDSSCHWQMLQVHS